MPISSSSLRSSGGVSASEDLDLTGYCAKPSALLLEAFGLDPAAIAVDTYREKLGTLLNCIKKNLDVTRTWHQQSDQDKTRFSFEILRELSLHGAEGAELLSNIKKYVDHWMNKQRYKQRDDSSQYRPVPGISHSESRRQVNVSSAKLPKASSDRSKRLRSNTKSAIPVPPDPAPADIMRFLEQCSPSMSYLTQSLIDAGCINIERVNAMSDWSTDDILDFLRCDVTLPNGNKLSPMEVRILAKHFSEVF
ncbi:hypothetical protein C8J56DRAFT_138741 [Mycena floridula]|nr:hypothetical protein C8J56DRAFT_138741 [Mycena floridula]